ncbi:MAG: arginine--tRNA ligase [Spirochaetales bacterium]|nr:arginine--tRNA ligase [Spirochaetales bacterium]
MKELKNKWAGKIAAALNTILESKGLENEKIMADDIIAEQPPRPELGDIAFPMFVFARKIRENPAAIAARVSGLLESTGAQADGPYINIRIDTGESAMIVRRILEEKEEYGKADLYKGRKVMIEFSCPNTNKPLHLGHLRNNVLGESTARLFSALGADVRKVNLINDRGIHICKSMLAYQKYGNGTTPDEQGIKSDRFVGDYYVKYANWEKEDPEAEKQARKMLIAWENNDPEVLRLWKTMNEWAISGIRKTYAKTGITFDQYYFESETYKSGREEILKGLEKGVFYREEDGSVWVDLSEIGLDKKVLLRKDGTSLYLTQDIGTAIARSRDYPFDKMIYVVASEQNYHFRVLFYVLARLGFSWADQLYHLSYGMINLPEGKMKSREGTVVDADDMIRDLSALAVQEIKDKEREAEIEDLEKTGLSIALAALHYYLLQVSPAKDMIFNPKESISFNGNTGPYIQYMGARISSMLEKYSESGQKGEFRPELLDSEEERELVRMLLTYPDTVIQAGQGYNPALLCAYIYDLAKSFSRFYHERPVLHAGNTDLTESRIQLSMAVLQILKNAGALLVIPFLEKM